MGRKFNLLLLSILSSYLLAGQQMDSSEIRRAGKDLMPEALSELITFLKIPNLGSDSLQVARNLAWCEERFSGLNYKTQILKTRSAPLLFAEKFISPDKMTVLFYLQIDGQPVDSTAWDQPNPYMPVIKQKGNDGKWQPVYWDGKSLPDSEWRLFGRSASDSKGPAMCLITVLDYFEKAGLEPGFNIKVVMDFQEELGSPALPPAVAENRNLFKADMLLIMDGTRHLSNQPTLTYGARGIATATITVFGPKSPLHSGQYGNYAPNPAFSAAHLISSLKDEKGRVKVKGFYEGVNLSERDKRALRTLQENEDSLNLRLGISQREAIGDNYQESLQYPSLNIRGLQSGWTGKEVRTLIPDEAVIEIDMRLVPETPGKRLIGLLKEHLSQEGYHLVDSLPTAEERSKFPKLARLEYRLGSQPFRTDMESEAGQFLTRALTPVFGDQIVHMRTTGGSQPIAPFVGILNLPAVSVRIPNPDNNIHAPDENLRLGNYLEGIMTCLAILNEPYSK